MSWSDTVGKKVSGIYKFDQISCIHRCPVHECNNVCKMFILVTPGLTNWFNVLVILYLSLNLVS